MRRARSSTRSAPTKRAGSHLMALSAANPIQDLSLSTVFPLDPVWSVLGSRASPSPEGGAGYGQDATTSRRLLEVLEHIQGMSIADREGIAACLRDNGS